MNYEWLDLGDQDECSREICCLGPYMLEHVEDHWEDGDIMMMANKAFLWNPLTDEYDEVETGLECIEYKRDKSRKILEDWYAMNVLSEKLWTGEPKDEKHTQSHKRSRHS